MNEPIKNMYICTLISFIDGCLDNINFKQQFITNVVSVSDGIRVYLI